MERGSLSRPGDLHVRVFTVGPKLCADCGVHRINCALDGAAYESTYGITTSGSSLKLDFVTGSNVGSRVYLMDENDEKYRLFQVSTGRQ